MKTSTAAGRVLIGVCVAIALGVAAGCEKQRMLGPSPYASSDVAGIAAYADVPAALQGTTADVLYVTDRSIDKQTPQGPSYGYGRERSTAYGTAVVKFGGPKSWNELVVASTQPGRSGRVTLSVESRKETGKLTSIVDRWQVVDNKLTLTPETKEAIVKEKTAFQDELRARLAKTPYKDVYVFIHGYNNTFDSAVMTTAELWHKLGRRGVPVTYTWPAGSPGLLGYFQDRESGEFSIVHLKQFIRAVSECPEVERLHLVAHSRGTDITFTAVRELVIEKFAEGLDPQKALKLETLVLAAPDIDAQVFGQRFLGEGTLMGTNRTVIYVNEGDKAIALAQTIFRGRVRLGEIKQSDFPPHAKELMANLNRLQLVSCNVSGFDITTHWYLFDHPAAVSDLILVLRDRRDAGAQYGRPLESPVPGFWRLDNNYLKPKTVE